jgi:GNAT superfamily N-acetyltransferase
MTGSVVIRAAQPQDAESGAACHLACWREAYADIVDPARLATLTAPIAERIELWRRWINEGRPIIVAVDSGHVVGFSVAGIATEPDIDIDFQLYAINVRQTYWGTGVARRLHDRSVGNRAAFLWVLRDNPRARAFYARNGYRLDGAEKLEEDFGATIIRMVRH